MIIIDLLLVAALGYATFIGTKRGLVLISLELGSFILATAGALLLYHALSLGLKTIIPTSNSLRNVFAFTVIWIIIELTTAIFVRAKILPRLTKHLKPSRLHQIGGAILSGLKTLIVITLACIVFAGLPLSPGPKRLVTESFIAQRLLASSGQLQAWLASGLGHDLSESLNFYTVTAEPESEQRIELGYTTTAVSVDEADETAMLDLVNQERTSRGLKPLKPNDKARAVARTYSKEMFARGFFSHVDPEGHTPFDRMRRGDVMFDGAGENLALAPTLQLAHQGLMNSPGHRANILKPEFRTVGIGIIDGGPYGLMITQDFTD